MDGSRVEGNLVAIFGGSWQDFWRGTGYKVEARGKTRVWDGSRVEGDFRGVAWVEFRGGL